MSSLHLINPAVDFPSYFGAEVLAASGRPQSTSVADLALPTLAAMAPDGFEVTLSDENTQPANLDTPARFVGLTGKITQVQRMIAISAEMRRRGKIVIAGGPLASLSPELIRPHCDILVRGEVEEIAPQLFADLREGTYRDEYVGGRPDLSRSPVPRWSAYPNDRALLGALQTSRGCPFECEFCDVIQYLGRRQRRKPVALVERELDELYRFGYRKIFISDDNFTVHRSDAKELLLAIAHWNERQDEPVHLVTQVSIDAARDDELLSLCARAGLRDVFVGIETPNEASLRETRKRQNVGIDLNEEANRFLAHGIMVTAGMIVGFDSDDAGIFARQEAFAESSAIPIFTLGALVAPAATPLHARLSAAGRLVEEGSEVAGMPWSTNIVPKQMSRPELLAGLRALCNRIYHPAVFGARLLRFVERLGKDRPLRPPGRSRPVEREAARLLGRFRDLGPVEAAVWVDIMRAVAAKPGAEAPVAAALFMYMQIRHMYDVGHVWEPITGMARRPPADARVPSTPSD